MEPFSVVGRKLALKSTGNYDTFSSVQTRWINMLGVEAWPTGIGSFIKGVRSGVQAESSTSK